MIYLDNAATSFPKPAGVAAAMVDYLENVGASPGRSGHPLAAQAGRIVFQTRKALARLFKLDDPGRIVFTENATSALNLALFGLLRPGDRVLTTALEHNAVMRPLRHLEETLKLEIDILPGTDTSHYDLKLLPRWCEMRRYRLAVVNSASNVIGTRAPLASILPILREHKVLSVVDGAQSAGACSLDLGKLDPDIFCFTGHKSLLGPPGTGGIYIKAGIEPQPLIYGGTGSRSETEYQPEFLPDCYESGTPNTVGLAGLKAGLEFVATTGLENIVAHEGKLVEILRGGLAAIDGLTLYGPKSEDEGLSVLSFNVAGLSCAEVGDRLARDFGIMTRVGLHCAPLAHRNIATFPHGTVRLAPGYFNSAYEMEEVVAAVAKIAGGGHG